MKDLERLDQGTEILPERSNIWVRFETFWNEPVREKRLSVLLLEDLQNRSSSLLELSVSDMFQNLVVLPSNLRKVISINYVVTGASEVYSLNPVRMLKYAN